ncbi:hypothetical protein J6590_015901 [Homalodisca vitripennis]|nr:hypothetical protein J6590_015901 [Homalodisca vitripennis]
MNQNLNDIKHFATSAEDTRTCCFTVVRTHPQGSSVVSRGQVQNEGSGDTNPRTLARLSSLHDEGMGAVSASMLVGYMEISDAYAADNAVGSVVSRPTHMMITVTQSQ